MGVFEYILSYWGAIFHSCSSVNLTSHSCQDHNQMLHLAWELNIKLRPLKLVGHPTNPTGRQVGLRPTQKAAYTLHAV
jgi:hypothetical protein